MRSEDIDESVLLNVARYAYYRGTHSIILWKNVARLSCCKGRKKSLYDHVHGWKHHKTMVKENPEELISTLKYFGISIDLFDIKKAPLYLPDKIAVGTLKGSYLDIFYHP